MQRRLLGRAAVGLSVEPVEVLGEEIGAEIERRREAARTEVTHHRAHLIRKSLITTHPNSSSTSGSSSSGDSISSGRKCEGPPRVATAATESGGPGKSVCTARTARARTLGSRRLAMSGSVSKEV